MGHLGLGFERALQAMKIRARSEKEILLLVTNENACRGRSQCFGHRSTGLSVPSPYFGSSLPLLSLDATIQYSGTHPRFFQWYLRCRGNAISSVLVTRVR